MVPAISRASSVCCPILLPKRALHSVVVLGVLVVQGLVKRAERRGLLRPVLGMQRHLLVMVVVGVSPLQALELPTVGAMWVSRRRVLGLAGIRGLWLPRRDFPWAPRIHQRKRPPQVVPRGCARPAKSQTRNRRKIVRLAMCHASPKPSLGFLASLRNQQQQEQQQRQRQQSRPNRALLQQPRVLYLARLQLRWLQPPQRVGRARLAKEKMRSPPKSAPHAHCRGSPRLLPVSQDFRPLKGALLPAPTLCQLWAFQWAEQHLQPHRNRGPCGSALAAKMRILKAPIPARRV